MFAALANNWKKRGKNPSNDDPPDVPYSKKENQASPCPPKTAN
jgi:hypothetical protein